MRRADRVIALLTLSAGAYALAVRPRLLRWDASDEEVRRQFPGAELVPGGERGATMAVTIDAPPSRVWPWLVQMGCHRAGWYSWDRLDNGGVPSAERIHPEWQGLAVGDRLASTPSGSAWFEVAALEPERFLGLRASLDWRGRPVPAAGPRPRFSIDALWGFLLEAWPRDRTRLVVSGYARARPRLLHAMANLLFWEPAHWVMQARQLANLKRRAERQEGEQGDAGGGRETRALRPGGHRGTAGPAPLTEGKMVRWARLYDAGTTLLSFGRLAALHRRIVALAAIRPGERVLDVGCGPGRLAILAAAAAGPSGEACGIDPAPEMIALARQRAPQAGARVRFETGVIEALPYPPDHFDVVLSSLMLHHLPDHVKRRGLAEIHRVLRPAGRLVAVDFGATPAAGIGHLLCVLRLRTGWDHAEHLRGLLRDAGFEAVEIGPTGHRALAFVRGRKPPAMLA